MNNTTGTAWTNWFGNQRCQPERVERPKTECDVQAAVAGATRGGAPVRVVGGGHSLPPVVNTDGVLLDLADMDKTLAADLHTHTAKIGAGQRLRDIFDPLWDAGLALKNMGELADGTIAGAVATGAHGTGTTLQCTSASVTAARIVTAGGDVLEVSKSIDAQLLRAAQVAVGMLGVFTEVTLECMPAYELQEHTALLTVDEITRDWETLSNRHRHFSFYYLATPAAGEAFADQLSHLPTGVNDVGFATIIDIVDSDTPAPDPAAPVRRDRMNRILNIEFDPNYRETEYAVPANVGKDTFLELRELLLAKHPGYAYPINVRFVAGDDAYLSAYNGGPKVVFSVSDHPSADWHSVLADTEQLFQSRGGLPHWGKEHSLTKETASQLFPDFDRFVEVRRQLDPTGVFLNDHLRPIFE